MGPIKDNSVLPSLDSYSADQIATATRESSAIQRYLRLISESKAKPDSKLGAADSKLHIARHRAWCEAALAAILKTAPAQSICSYWSRATDEILQGFCDEFHFSENGLAFFALGKWGSSELNLSSDIDVIFVSRDTPSVEQFKLVRRFIQFLSQPTEFGFAYRVDTDLKPGGRLAPVISSVRQFEDHYWSAGATWERLALVRLRAIAGASDVIHEIEEVAQHFCFRKFLDYGLLEDLRHLRSQIHFYGQPANGHSKQNSSINLKLAPGGIRDIELFLHALQIIHGGRDKRLRLRSTDDAAKALLTNGHFSPDDLTFLIDSYWVYRDFENQVQAVDDQQTHVADISAKPEIREEFTSRATRVDEIVAKVLGRPGKIKNLPESDSEQTAWLASLGYSEATIAELWPKLLHVLDTHAKTYRESELRQKILRELVEACAKEALDKDLALALVFDFVRSIRAHSSLLSLLAHENKLLVELSRLFGCSPYLGGVIASRPELLDGFLYRRFAHAPQGSNSESFELWLEELAEQRLLSEIVAASRFLQDRRVDELTTSLTATADDIAQTLLVETLNDLKPEDLTILALGKWGGCELGLKSDLDFIFVTDKAVTDSHQKLARRFISRLTERHRGGPIYSVDLRLRPSGRAGPLIVEISALIEYLKKQAQPWERQSYLRARWVAPTKTKKQKDFLTALKKACVAQPLSREDLVELARIRNALIKPNGDGVLDLKYSAGGLIDIEFYAQVLTMDEQNAQWDGVTLSALKNSRLQEIYEKLRQVEQLTQLLAEYSTTELDIKSDIMQRLARFFKQTAHEYFKSVENLLTESNEILKEVDPRRRS